MGDCTECSTPTVSVVMPAYNTSSTIGEALSALAAQDFDDFEVVVVDDGSTDETAHIASRFAKNDLRIRVLRRTHAGAGAARNAGIGEARGRYLLFLDADDLFEPNLISSLCGLAANTGADVAMCSADRFAVDAQLPTGPWEAPRWELGDGCWQAGQLAGRLYQATTVVVWNKLFDAAFVSELGLRFQNLPRFNDACFTICALALSRSIAKTRDVLVHYRQQSGSLVDAAHGNPLCDLYAFDAARSALSQWGLLGSLQRSFDTLCVNTVVWRLRQFSRVSPAATAELFNAYFGFYERKWGISDKRFPHLASLRYAIERDLMKYAGAQGIVAASMLDDRDRGSAPNAVAELAFAGRLAASCVPSFK